jgi:hypothetical protein
MKLLESGSYQLSSKEISELAPAAERYENTYGKHIDLTRPLELEEAMYLKLSQAAVECNLVALERVLAVLDEAIARAKRPN